MKKGTYTAYLILLLLVALMIGGCKIREYPLPTPSHTPVPTSVLATQSQQPDIRGEIVAILENEGQINAIHVEGAIENDTRYDKATARITDKTKIYISKGERYESISIDQLEVGMIVEVLFTGIVLERYPVSAEAAEILVVP